MSAKQVVPERIISAIAKSAPCRTNSSDTNLDSRGQIDSSSHSVRGVSSAIPRSKDMAEWPWVLISPGMSAWLSSTMVSAALIPVLTSSFGQMATILLPLTARQWSSKTVSLGDTGIIHFACINRSASILLLLFNVKIVINLLSLAI